LKNAVFWDVAPVSFPKRRLTQDLHGVTSQKTAQILLPSGFKVLINKAS
jgi:hypothetical protein